MACFNARICTWTALLLCFSKMNASYVEVCETVMSTMYCHCETSHSDTYRLSCLILQSIEKHDPVWRSIGESNSISYLKLNPRLPLRLEYIPSELSGMGNLQVLEVSEGTLGVLNTSSISGYNSLQELKLDGNEISALEYHAISNLPKLKKLSLSQNNLQELLADSLSGLLELEMLFLDSNNISRMEICAFCELQNLRELELWKNQISDLTAKTFSGLRFLRRLDLFKNKIRILNNKVFQYMPSLVEIDLKDNLISHIAPRAFFGLNKLQTLLLNNNHLKYLPDEVFIPLTSLRSLELYKNEIEVLQNEIIYSIKHAKDRGFSITFKENPFRCDCRMSWVGVFLTNVNNSEFQFKRELEEVQCTLENGTALRIAEFLSTADCKSSTIKPRAPAPSFKYTTKATDSVPVELQSQRSNAASFSVEDDAADDPYSNDVQESGNSGCVSTHCSLICTLCAVLWTSLLIKRKVIS